LVSYLPLMSRAIDIASQMRCGVYDCLYVALAEKEGCGLLRPMTSWSRILRRCSTSSSS
jgi:hypothetical protein